MHKQFSEKHGFTIIELIVVITVIAILTTISVISYEGITLGGRDDKRKADISALMHELDTYYQTNNEYPVGCAMTNAQCVTVSSTGSKQSDPGTFNTSSGKPPLNATASLTTLRSVLPGLNDSFGDPNGNKNKPFIDNYATGQIMSYFYTGGLFNNTAAPMTKNITFSGTAQLGCSISVTLQPQQASTYIVGYYSESDKVWRLKNGPHGTPFTAPGTAPAITCSSSSKAGAVWSD